MVSGLDIMIIAFTLFLAYKLDKAEKKIEELQNQPEQEGR